MKELTYESVDEALVDALTRLQTLRSCLCDERAARELEILHELIEAVRAELRRDTDAMISDGDSVHRTGALPPMLPLTQREEEVLQLMALGLRNKEIAGALGVTERTAAFHVGNVLAKLGADGRVEAIYLACERKLLRDAAFSR